ncbi:entericidin A/B family lipoprotein [Rhodobacterales bacterium HKCCE4037]|nr:entericidin A/B family lipoprotein [Rhodobacterales bacterium HKCCE4037]
MFRLVLMIAALFTLTACETVGGFGRDVSDAGQGISATAQAVEDEIED